MAFWCRINWFKLRHLPNQIVQRYYLGNSNASHTNPCVVEKPYWVIHSGPISFCNNVRFLAAQGFQPYMVMIWVWQFDNYLRILLKIKKKKKNQYLGTGYFVLFFWVRFNCLCYGIVCGSLGFWCKCHFFQEQWGLVLMSSCRPIIEFSW